MLNYTHTNPLKWTPRVLIYRLVSGVLYCLFPTLVILQPIKAMSTYGSKTNVADTTNFFSEMLQGDPFSISGTLNLSTRSYNAFNTPDRQSPFIWYLNTNVNMRVYNINIPVSAIISAQNEQLSHPFNRETLDNLADRRFTRIGMSPNYKWIKLHAGHRSMNFSPMTVSNHVFLGGGMELTPGKVRFAHFYGRMAKTEPRDLALTGFNQQVFSRTGYGFKVGYGSENDFLDIILFKARDNDNAFQDINTDTTSVFRNENSVLAINGKAVLMDRVRLNLELSASAFTENSNDPILDNGEGSIHDFLLSKRLSTKYRKAINAGVNFDGDLFTLGMGYKRIEPEYRSLGAYFFNNDLEHYPANLGFSLLKNRLKVNATLGIQKNNLFEEKATQLNRNISSINLNYFYNALNLGLNYSNFSSEVSFVLNPDLDSLNAIIVTDNLSLNGSYTIVNNRNDRHLISMNIALQAVTDDLQNQSMSAESQMINLLASYRMFPNQSVWKFNSMLNFNQNELSNILIRRYGMGFGAERTIIQDKLSFGLQTVYYISSGENINNQTINIKGSIPYTINKRHRINLGLLYLNRINGASSMMNDFQELTIILNYGYKF